MAQERRRRKSVGNPALTRLGGGEIAVALSQVLVKMRSDIMPPSPGDGLSDDSHRDDARRHDAGTPNPGFRRTGVGTGNSGSSSHSHWGGVRLASRAPCGRSANFNLQDV